MRNLFRTPRPRKRFSRLDRPYVLWTLRDGSQILANRHYDVIAERAGFRSIGHIIDRWRWVEGIVEERWIQTPEFPTLAACRRWCDEILWRFLDGEDMGPVLQAHPIKRHTGAGEKRDRSAPEDWPPAWPAGLRLRSEPEVPVPPARIIPLGPFPTPPDATPR
jgi:hypothetical protein